MMRMVILLSLMGLLSGCWCTHVTDGMISTRDVAFGKSYRIDRSRRICATDRKHIILYFPTGVPSPQEAVDRAMNDGGGREVVVGLADAKVTYKWFWLYLYGQMWFTAEGYPVYARQESLLSPKETTPDVKKKILQSSSKTAIEPCKPAINDSGSLGDLPF